MSRKSYHTWVCNSYMPECLSIEQANQIPTFPGCFRGAVNIPSEFAFTSEGKLASCPEASALAALKGNIIAIFGNEEDRRRVANQLVHLEYRHVCILDAEVHDVKSRLVPPICLY